MTKLYVTLAAVAALLAAPALSVTAFAGAITASEANLATLDAPAETNTVRKIDLQTEPIQQSQESSTPENQSADQYEPAPGTAAPANAGAATEAAAANTATTADTAEPRTAKRLCKKFSAAIAMVIDVPCE